jgi:hypothetical protein
MKQFQLMSAHKQGISELQSLKVVERLTEAASLTAGTLDVAAALEGIENIILQNLNDICLGISCSS